MPKISKLYAREILDSRSTPTVEAVVYLEDGSWGVASVPSGSSTGTYEALELRDNDPARYLGQGVLSAVNNINTEIALSVVGQNYDTLSHLDDAMIRLDGTPNKSRLGANAILGVSMSAAKAMAMSAKTPLYKYIAGISGNTQPLYIQISCAMLAAIYHIEYG